MQEKYDWQQKVISLIWLSYCISIPKTYFGSQEYLQNLATKSIEAVLADGQIQTLIGKWQMVWGCGVSQLSNKLHSSNVNDHTIFMVKDLGSTELDRYVISLAGTNPFSLQNIFLEDVNIRTSKPWNNGQPWKSPTKLTKSNNQPAVTMGISKSLKTLMTEIRSEGKLLLDFLKELTTTAKKPIEITVAGHSLAGAMSPSLALSLIDLQSEWDLAKIATLKVVSVAGFSPGNGAFADYYNQTLGQNTLRIWNSSDLVPNVWEAEALKRISGLYSPHIPPSSVLELVFKEVGKVSQEQDYQFILKSIAGFASEYKPNLEKDPIIKDVVLDMCSEIIAYSCLMQLKAEPIFSTMFEDQIEEFTNHLADSIKEELKIMFVDGEIREEALKESLKNSLDKFGGFGVDVFRLPMPENINKIFSQSAILELINYVLQVLYQHVWAYVDYYKISEFDQRRQEVTTQTIAKIQEAKNNIQQANTIVINYGAAKSEDIDDLYNGQGKLFTGIADALKALKQSDEVSNNAQPIIFVVEKKKDNKGIFDWF